MSLLIALNLVSLVAVSAKPDTHPAFRQVLALLRRGKRREEDDSTDPNPGYEESGMSSIVLGILIAVVSVIGIVLIAYIVYRYRKWTPRTKPSTVRRGSVSSTPETQKLVNPGIAVPVTR